MEDRFGTRVMPSAVRIVELAEKHSLWKIQRILLNIANAGNGDPIWYAVEEYKISTMSKDDWAAYDAERESFYGHPVNFSRKESAK